jgi:hypothetical protein
MTNNENYDEEKETRELLKNGFRWKTGAYERLVCQRMFQATSTTDVKSIIENVTAAASMVEESKNKVEGLDFRKLKVIKQISDDLNLKRNEYVKFRLPKRGKYDYTPRTGLIYPVPWSVTQSEEFFNSYVAPWLSPDLNYYSEGISKHKKTLTKLRHADQFYGFGWGLGKGCNKVLETISPRDAKKKTKEWIEKPCPHCGKTIGEEDVTEDTGEYVVNEPAWSFFWELSQFLSWTGLKKLRTSFNVYAREECLKAITVMSDLVSERTFNQVVKLLRNVPEKEEENEE